jgi:hypothetical protein
MQLILREENIIQRLFNSLKLTHRLPHEQLADTIIPMGLCTPNIQSLNLQLAVRVINYRPEIAQEALATGDLIQIFDRFNNIRSIRPWDLPLVTTAIAPSNEEELLSMMGEDSTLFTPFSLAPLQLLHRLQQILYEVPFSSMSAKHLETFSNERMLKQLPPSDREIWTWPSEQHPHHTLGEHLLQLLIHIASLSVPLMLLGQDRITLAPPIEQQGCSCEAIRSFLHAFAPATIADSARYFGISLEHATRLWEHLPLGQLIPVLWQKEEGWMLASDVGEVQNPTRSEGVKFISRDDPLLAGFHRDLLIHGKSQYRYFFRNSEPPGMVFFDGSCVAGWRMRFQQQGCFFVIEDIGEPLGKVAIDELESEACMIAQALDCSYAGLVVEKV